MRLQPQLLNPISRVLRHHSPWPDAYLYHNSVKRFRFLLTISIVVSNNKLCPQSETKLLCANCQPLLTSKPLPEMQVSSQLSGSPTDCGNAHACILCKR